MGDFMGLFGPSGEERDMVRKLLTKISPNGVTPGTIARSLKITYNQAYGILTSLEHRGEVIKLKQNDRIMFSANQEKMVGLESEED
jgi:ribosomal protein S25